MEATEVILANGHTNIQATYRTTLEITEDADLSKNGDCIIAVSASKALTDFDPKFKKLLQRENAKLTILIQAGEVAEVVNAFGSSRLVLTHQRDMVIRKSGYICKRTLAIKADKAALDLSKKFVNKLKDPKQEVKITLTVRA